MLPGPSVPRPRPRPKKRALEEINLIEVPQIEDAREVLDNLEGSFSCIQNSEEKVDGGRSKKRRI